MPMDRKRSKREEADYVEMLHWLETTRRATSHEMQKRKIVPQEWYNLHRETPVTPKKEKVTLRLDGDMLAWYRGLGTGWSPLINAVLRAYMKALLAKEIERVGDRDWKGDAI